MMFPRTHIGILLLATGFSSGCDWFPSGENGDSSPTLPPLTSLRRESLEHPLVLSPFGGDGRCFYNIIRDEKLQSYHQIGYPREVWP